MRKLCKPVVLHLLGKLATSLPAARYLRSLGELLRYGQQVRIDLHTAGDRRRASLQRDGTIVLQYDM